MEINKKIEEISKKYKYDNELMEALKRCVSSMIKGKSNSEIELLLETLERVEIFDFREKPTQEKLDQIEKRKTNGRNEQVEFIKQDKGEYEKTIPPGAYTTTPIFNKYMEIVDRVGYIYLTRLYENSATAKTYQTTINLSHLIHELGHAWVAQKDEYIQGENGNYVCKVGATTMSYSIEKENCIVTENGVKGLFIEEALNTLEEERVLCEILGIDKVEQIPGYVPSQYQGLMKGVIKEYTHTIGELPFSKLRILKNNKEINQYLSIIDSTEVVEYFKTDEWKERKRRTFDEVKELENVSENKKIEMQQFFLEYEDVYFSTQNGKSFMEKLDNILEQIYNFYSIKYGFNIMESNKNLDIYRDIQTEILREAYIPLNHAREQIEEYKKSKENISMNDLVKQALQTGQRESEQNMNIRETNDNVKEGEEK